MTSAYTHLQSRRWRVGKRDFQCLAGVALLLWTIYENFLQLAGDYETRYAITGRLFLWLGLVQEGLIEGYMLSSCSHCHQPAQFCNCELVFDFARNTMTVAPMTMHLAGMASLRNLLQGLGFLTNQRPVPPRGVIWTLIFRITLMKCVILLFHYSLSKTFWEWTLLGFIARGWEDSEAIEFGVASMVYIWTGCFSRQSYIGETSVGLMARFISHLNAWLGRRRNISKTYRASALYDALGSRGLRRFCMFPIFMWAQPVSKYARLHWLAFAVWERQPTLNKSGRNTFALKDEQRHDHIHVPKKRAFRLVIRLRKVEKARRGIRTLAVTRDGKEAILRNEMANRSAILNTMVRLARRPMRMNAGFQQLAIVRTIGEMSVWKVGRLFRAGNEVFTGATRSIYFKNLSLCVKTRKDIIFDRWQQTNEAFQIPRIMKEVLRVLRNWTYRLANLGLYLVLRIRTTPGYGQSILDCFQNTNKWGSKLASDCVCACDSVRHMPLTLWKIIFSCLSLNSCK